jgi:PAS domain-containing protein
MDITPVGFIVTGVILAWGISRGRLFDLVPVARDILIESMGDCLLVLDDQNRVIDINPAARRLVGRWKTALDSLLRRLYTFGRTLPNIVRVLSR